jgi:lysyl-tRNA synthetase class 1
MKNGYEKNLRDWFGVMYETLLGQTQGPRMGSFILLYGRENMMRLIAEKLEN